jgi:hypothetical protein
MIAFWPWDRHSSAPCRFQFWRAREILGSDRSGSRAVAVINERFAKVNFDKNPLGQHVTLWKGKQAAHATWRLLAYPRMRDTAY